MQICTVKKFKMVDRLVNSEANARRIACVEQCFGSSGEPLQKHGRVLVGEGVLTKMCRKKTKPRIFFLFNDIIVYGNIVIHKKRYNKQHVIPIKDVKLEDVPDNSNNKNGWKIISPHKSFVVHAATVTEKKEWMAHIRKCVNDLITKGGVDPVSGKEAPVWMPDSSATVCMHCNKYEFSMINRRHHCRNCGKVVCHPCSNQKWPFPEQSDKPLRVCLTCYHMLSSDSNSKTYSTNSAGTGNSSGDSSDDDETTNGSVPANTHFQSYDSIPQ